MTTTVTLSEQLTKVRDGFIANLPPEQKETIGAALQKLMASDFGDRALNKGDAIAAFSLNDPKGETLTFPDALSGKPLVLSFYRGGWCPFCNLEFKALIDILPEIKAAGANLIGISPEKPDVAQQTVDQHGINFQVLCDPGNQVAARFGLVMDVFEEIRPLYLQWGLNLPAANGDDSWQLPIPATYIIDGNGVIRAAHVNKDYTQRMEPADILEALNGLA